MTILALESSSKAAGCALMTDGILRAEQFLNTGLTHSETLMPMVRDMLRQTGLTMDDVDLFAVSTGPGSFTGLRIGIAAVKGLAMAVDRPCAGVSTLQGLAWNLRMFSGYLAPVMDARRSQVYTALFSCDGTGDPVRVETDDAISLEILRKRLEALAPQPVMLVGDGAAMCFDQLSDLTHIRLCPEQLRHQRAASVAAAAATVEPVDAASLMPVYLRLSQAERELLERQKEAQE